MEKWRCKVCGHIHIGKNPPEICPICGVKKSEFILYKKDEKDEYINKNLEEIKSETFDVIIVGSGAGGLAGAITTNDLNLTTVILEKANTVGGTSARSGGRYWIPNNKAQKELGIIDNKEDCIKYMAKYSYPHKYDVNKINYGLTEYAYNLMEIYYDNASKTMDFFSDKGILESECQINWKGKAEIDYMDTLKEQGGIRGRTILPKVGKGSMTTGKDLIDILHNYLIKKNVQIKINNRVVELLTNKKNEVIGIITESKNTRQKIYARKGVIFASGGFSHNDELMENFQPGPHYGGCAVGENTGDIINITAVVGAKLGHMNNAFRVQSIVELYFDNPTGSSSLFYVPGDSILEINKHGKRIVNEKRNYTDRTMAHFYWNPVKGEFTNRFVFLIFDKRCIEYWAGFPPFPIDIKNTNYIISGDNFSELTENIKLRLEKLNDKTKNFKLENDFENNFLKTIERFNLYAKNGVDEEFSRGESSYDNEIVTFPPFNPEYKWPPENSKNPSMYPISDEGPYYAIILGAGTLDTSGGPMIDINGQILNYENKPIKGLYGAGNCIASPSKNAYWGAGATLGPAMTFAHLGGKHLAKQNDTDFN